MEVSRGQPPSGALRPLPKASPKLPPTGTPTQSRDVRGLPGSPWWSDHTLAPTSGHPALIRPQKGWSPDFFVASAHPTFPAPLSPNSLLN